MYQNPDDLAAAMQRLNHLNPVSALQGTSYEICSPLAPYKSEDPKKSVCRRNAAAKWLLEKG